MSLAMAYLPGHVCGFLLREACMGVYSCVCNRSKLVSPCYSTVVMGQLFTYRPGGVSRGMLRAVCRRANRASTCVLQISVEPPTVWACVFCLSALWASLHGSGMMDGFECLGATEPHCGFLCV